MTIALLPLIAGTKYQQQMIGKQSIHACGYLFLVVSFSSRISTALIYPESSQRPLSK